MRAWSMEDMTVGPSSPEVLYSSDEGRAIAIHLDAGDRLGEHEVHERAWAVVAAGRVRIAPAVGEARELGPGSLAEFDPHERREIVAVEETRLLLLLTPWPAEDRQPVGQRSGSPRSQRDGRAGRLSSAAYR